MNSIVLNIELSSKDRLELERIFQDRDNIEEVAQIVAQIAFEEFLGWLSGSVRYTSLTDQSIDRVVNLFIKLMPDREPDVNFLYNKFNIPYGRARYIVQVISELQLREWNQLAREQLIEALQASIDEVKEKNPKTITEVKIQVSRRSGKILTYVIEQMFAEKQVVTFKQIKSPLPELVVYTFSPKDIESVFESVKKYFP